MDCHELPGHLPRFWPPFLNSTAENTTGIPSGQRHLCGEYGNKGREGKVVLCSKNVMHENKTGKGWMKFKPRISGAGRQESCSIQHFLLSFRQLDRASATVSGQGKPGWNYVLQISRIWCCGSALVVLILIPCSCPLFCYSDSRITKSLTSTEVWFLNFLILFCGTTGVFKCAVYIKGKLPSKALLPHPFPTQTFPSLVLLLLPAHQLCPTICPPLRHPPPVSLSIFLASIGS